MHDKVSLLKSSPLNWPSIDDLPTCVLVVNERGKVISANPRACAELRTEVSSLVGADVETVLATLSELQSRLDRGRGVKREPVRIRHEDGSEERFGLSVSKAERVGHVAYVVIFRNISEMVRVRDQRDRLMRLATVADILPSMLHEIKNPLAAITATAEIALEEASSGSRASLTRDLHLVLGELRRMTLTLEGVGMIGRTFRAQRSAAVDFAVSEVCRIFEGKTKPRKIEIISSIETMPLLPFDLSVVRAIMFNLINNAIQAIGSDGTLRVGARLVDEQRTLHLSVDDTGPGMSNEVRRRCQELFFSTKPGGSGIGLALVARLVKFAGGSVEVKSAPGSGCQITLRVPVAPRDVQRPHPVLQQSVASSGSHGANVLETSSFEDIDGGDSGCATLVDDDDGGESSADAQNVDPQNTDVQNTDPQSTDHEVSKAPALETDLRRAGPNQSGCNAERNNHVTR